VGKHLRHIMCTRSDTIPLCDGQTDGQARKWQGSIALCVQCMLTVDAR